MNTEEYPNNQENILEPSNEQTNESFKISDDELVNTSQVGAENTVNFTINQAPSELNYTFRAEEEYLKQSQTNFDNQQTYNNSQFTYNDQANANSSYYYSGQQNDQFIANNSMQQNYGYQPNNYSYQNPGNEQNAQFNYNNMAYTVGNPTIPPYNFNAPKPKKEKKPASKAKRFFKKTGIILASAACFGLVAGATFIGTNELYKVFNPETASEVTLTTFDSQASNRLLLDPVVDSELKIESTQLASNINVTSTDVSAVVEASMPFTVAIESTFQVQTWYYGYYDEQQGGGSGIIVGKNESELLIATNNHVIDSATKIEVILNDGSRYEAITKGRDALADLAVIAIPLESMTKESIDNVRIATLGDSDAVNVGQMAIAIGNALGYGQSATVGYISAKDREVKVDDQTMILLQTDAAINPGNSGGALLNISGEVIGINSIKYTSNDVEGMGFAIPINRARVILDELMTREIIPDKDKGYLGVYIDDVTASIAAAYNWPVGVYVTELVEGGAAEKAGIYVGDIITAINSTTVTTGNMLREKVTSYKYGTKITVTLQRLEKGEFVEKTIDVILQQNDEQPEEKVETDK